MKFLVILICLMANYLWLKDVDRFDDGWFFRFRRRVEQWSHDLVAQYSHGWVAALALVYGVPLLTLLILLVVSSGSLFGLLTMLVHILVLLVALDRTQPSQQANAFLERWNAGDMSACTEFLEQEFGGKELPSAEDSDAISAYFCKQLAYRSFEKMFVMFFWYICTGPLGVLFSYISYQLRDNRLEDTAAKEIELVELIIQILEWAPLRLLALTFSLVGNFEQCFEKLRASFWQFDDTDNAELLYGFANCACAGQFAHGGATAEGGEEIPESQQEAAKIQALLGLLERSQGIWLCLLALLTIVAL